MNGVDFERLFSASPGCYLVLRPRGRGRFHHPLRRGRDRAGAGAHARAGEVNASRRTETIVTGIGATTAKTMVRLGIDATALYTCSRLKEGVDLAIRLTGERR